MELNKYIPNNVLAKLEEKGWDKSSIEEKVKEFYDERIKIGFKGEDAEKSTKSRCQGFFGPILRRNDISMKAIIFSLSNVEDDNDRMRRMSKLKEGLKGYKPNTDYEVKEGYYPWGNNQGLPISVDKQLQMQGFVGIEYNGKLHLKNIVFTGNWLDDKEVNKAKAGDVIRLNIDPSRLDGKTIFVNTYTYVEPLDHDKYLKMINEKLKKFHKTVSEINNENYKGLVIVKGNVSEITSTNFGFTFDIVDDADNWDVENSLIGSMQNVDFIEGAENVIFIGECYKRNNQPGSGLNIQKTIVPEQYQKKDLPKENLDAISEEYDNNMSGQGEEYDDDLL